MSLHVSDGKIAFCSDDSDPVLLRELDGKELKPAAFEEFLLANTGTPDFALGALAMLELIEADAGKVHPAAGENDPKAIQARVQAEKPPEPEAPVAADPPAAETAPAPSPSAP